MVNSLEVQKNNQIVTIILNRPDKFNAFDDSMIIGMINTLFECAADDNVKAIILTGKGKAFCAGGDLKSFKSDSTKSASQLLYELAGTFHQAIIEIRRMKKPVIAAINGVAAGGGFSLALACDFRIMARSTILRQAYTSSGLSIDGGGTFMLPRLVGYARAIEITAFDKPISSEQALNWGLVTKVVDDGDVLAEAQKMASILRNISTNSFAWSKKLLNDSFHTPLEVQLEQERIGISTCAGHPDGIEGLNAFIEKRKPVFNVYDDAS